MGCFSPFPHGTGSLSVRNEYLALRDGPRGFKQGFSCPALLRYLLRVWINFAYGSVTLFGATFQRLQLSTRLLTLLLQALQPPNYLDSTGLGYSDFARHYFRNHGCFLFLRVLRWFTSPGSLAHPMNSDARNGCSHPLGFPIRKSPDHSLLAASRSLSQLITSFIAYLRQGIHTHALSSLTIKSTSHTIPNLRFAPLDRSCRRYYSLFAFAYKTCVLYARQYSVVKDLDCFSNRLNRSSTDRCREAGIASFGGPG